GLVTGAAGEHGFGRAIARRLARAGADVVVTDLAPRGVRVVSAKPDGGWRGLEDTAGEVGKEGRRALALTLDVRAAAQIDSVIATTLATLGRVDILVNNAAAPPGAHPAGITVNAICPGPADTDRLDYLGRRPDGGFDPALRAAEVAKRAAAIPLGRLATVEDVAELTAFLASDGAGYVTGQAINVAGGS